MSDKIIYIGLDVDDRNFHGTAFNPTHGEIVEFKYRPNIKGLLNQLLKLEKKFQDHSFKICYEATYIGFNLQRDLEAKGYTLVGETGFEPATSLKTSCLQDSIRFQILNGGIKNPAQPKSGKFNIRVYMQTELCL